MAVVGGPGDVPCTTLSRPCDDCNPTVGMGAAGELLPGFQQKGHGHFFSARRACASQRACRSSRISSFTSTKMHSRLSCGACKFLRRKCVKGCVFAPYFCHEQGAAHFAAIHKVFGASNASKLLMHLPESERCEAAITMSYEAQARLHDPIYGCVAHIFSLQQQVVCLQAQLESLKAQTIQGYGDGPLTSNPQKENYESITPYMQDEQLFFNPTVPRHSSVKEENQLNFVNDCFTSGSTQYSEGYEPDLCMPDYYSSNHSSSVQGGGYHDMDDLAFAYLNQA